MSDEPSAAGWWIVPAVAIGLVLWLWIIAKCVGAVTR